MLERENTDITIYDSHNKVITAVPITADSKRVVKLMEEDYIQLVFSLDTAAHFPIGAYCDDELFGRFYVTEEQMPKYNTTTGGYDYELKMEAWYRAWGLKMMMLTAIDMAKDAMFRKEAEWHLCAGLKEQMREFMCNLQCLGYAPDCDFLVDDNDLNRYVHIGGEVSKAPQALLIDYASTSLIDTLKNYADLWECEWWVEGTEQSFCIYFGKCAYGEEKILTLGDPDNADAVDAINVERMEINKDTSAEGNKLFYYGSTENIPNTYRKQIALYACDVEYYGDAEDASVKSFLGKKYLTDKEASEDINWKTLPNTFNVEFSNSANRIEYSGKTSDGLLADNIVSVFRSKHSDMSAIPVEVARKVRFSLFLERYNGNAFVDRYDLSEVALSEISVEDYDCKLRITASQVWERYDEEQGVFAEVKSLPIMLSNPEWYIFAASFSKGRLEVDTHANYGYGCEVDFFFIGGQQDNGFIQSDYMIRDYDSEWADNARTVFPIEASFAEYSRIFMARKGELLTGHPLLRSDWNEIHSNVNRPYPSLRLESEYYEEGLEEDINTCDITNPEEVEQWNSRITDGYKYRCVYCVVSSLGAMSASEWLEAVRDVGAPLSITDNKIYFNGYEMSVSADGKSLRSSEIDPTELPADCYIDTTYRIQAVMTDYHAYRYSRQSGTANTAIEDNLAVDGYTAQEKARMNLSHHIYNAVVDNTPTSRRYTAICNNKVVSTDKTIKVTLKGQAEGEDKNTYTVKVRLKVRSAVPFYTMSCKMSYTAGLVYMAGTIDASKNRYLFASLPDRVIAKKEYEGDVYFRRFQEKDGYYYSEETLLQIDAAEMDLEMSQYDRTHKPYLSFAFDFSDMIFRNMQGTQIKDGIFGDRICDGDFIVDVSDTGNSIEMSSQGYGDVVYKAMFNKDNDKIVFVTYAGYDVTKNIFKEDTLFYIISDYDFSVPYKYFVNRYDDPTRVKTLGERRLLPPRYDEEKFSKYGVLYGMTYDEKTGYIHKGDYVYKDGYIIHKDYIGRDDAIFLKELSVADDSIYPDGKLLVHWVATTKEKTLQDVENDEDITWYWEQYHLQLRRPDEETPLEFDKRYILPDGEALKVRFLIPEDVKDAEGVTSEVYNQMQRQCLLSGMTFEVDFGKQRRINGEDYQNVFSTKRNEDFGCMLPNDILKPQVLDPCVLVGWNVKAMAALDLIAEAEYKMLNRAFEYFQELENGCFTFNCTMMSTFLFDLYGDTTYLASNEPKLLVEKEDRNILVKNGTTAYAIPMLGQRVQIRHGALASDKHTRVIGMELKMDKPYDSPVLTCGETEAYSRLKQIEKNLTILSR